MQRKNCTPAPQFVLKDRSNQELVDGAKHLVGRSRTVTAHLIAHLAEIYARKLHVAEGFSYLANYCMAILGMSEDEAKRRSHAAVLAEKYPVILAMLLEGSIHLTTLRIVGKCLTPNNHRQVLEAARGKSNLELEHLAAALNPKPDVPTVLRKLPEPRLESAQSEGIMFAGGQVDEREITVEAHEPATNGREISAEAVQVIVVEPAIVPPAPLVRPKSRLAPLSPGRYNLNLTINKDAYDALRELQDLLRHQVPNGDLITIVQDSILERRDRVKREKYGHGKRPRKVQKQESWIPEEKTVTAATAKKAPSPTSAAIQPPTTADANAEKQTVATPPKTREISAHASALGRSRVNSRHIPNAVKREVWERDKGRCAFVSRTGRRCSERGRLEFHHVHAYALGGPATVENIALRCRTHNAYEGVALFGEKRNVRSVNEDQRTVQAPQGA